MASMSLIINNTTKIKAKIPAMMRIKSCVDLLIYNLQTLWGGVYHEKYYGNKCLNRLYCLQRLKQVGGTNEPMDKAIIGCSYHQGGS